MPLAPIALFVYARPGHTRRTIEALRLNLLAPESDLVIFSDAARSLQDKEAVEEVRYYIQTIDGFRSLTIHYRPHNFGLANSIISGVSQIIDEYGQVIVLEDDMITSPFFLKYMNDALARYAEDERVISVHGYLYPLNAKLPETFFLLGADCWGWGTWRRAWSIFNPDGRFLLNELDRRDLKRSFDFNNTYPYSQMLRMQVSGDNDSWAIRWYASAFLANKLTLYPNRSLIHNIGNDSSGTHCNDTRVYDNLLSATPINVEWIKVQPSYIAYRAFASFFKSRNISIWSKIFLAVNAFIRNSRS